MASSYERELRAVLAGSPDGVRAVTRSCTELERARAMQVVQRPFGGQSSRFRNGWEWRFVGTAWRPMLSD